MLILRARQRLWWSNLRKELLPHTWFAVLQLIIKIKIVEVALDHTRRSIQHSQNIFDCLGQVVIDAVVCVLPVVWGLPPTIVSAYFQAFVYDRQWFFEQCAYIDQMRGVPGLLPTLCYLQVAGSCAASLIRSAIGNAEG